MAIPSGKYYDKIGDFYGSNIKKRDLSEVCESDLAGGHNRINESSTQYFTGYKNNGNMINIPNYPSQSSAPKMKLVSLNYKYDSNPIRLPYIGSVPSMFNITQTNPGIIHKLIEGPDSGNVTHNISYNESTGWEVDDEIFPPSVFYKGIVPHYIIVLLQGAGGGGGSRSAAGSQSFGGGGGGSGATAWCVCTMGSFKIRLGAPGAANEDGGAAALNSPISTETITAMGGSCGKIRINMGSNETGGAGGTVFISGLSYNGGSGHSGFKGGNNGIIQSGGGASGTAGGSTGTQGIWLYDSTDWSYDIQYSGGAATTGGGGGASYFANGAAGGGTPETYPGTQQIKDHHNPTQPGYGAGGGGSNADVRSSAGPGGKACAVIYFGYSA